MIKSKINNNDLTEAEGAAPQRRAKIGRWGSAARIAGRMDPARALKLRQTTPHPTLSPDGAERVLRV